jgi:hypothetical protein
MNIKQNEFSHFTEKGKIKILNLKSVVVCTKEISKKLLLKLYSINNYFVEVLEDETGKKLSVKEVNLDYVSKFYCMDFSIQQLEKKQA